MIIGRFQKEGDGFTGSIETLGIRLNRVGFKHRDKGANYVVHGPDDGDLGAAWVKAGDFGDYLSVKLDCPSLAAPINATMKLTATDEGFFLLRWSRRSENGRGNAQPDRSE